VVQYDLGKTGAGGYFTRTGSLNTPPTVLLNALSKLRSNHHRCRSSISTYLSSICRLSKFSRNGAGSNVLFESTYDHIEGPTCDRCSRDRAITRAAREVTVYYGTIASGNQVYKGWSNQRQDKLGAWRYSLFRDGSSWTDE